MSQIMEKEKLTAKTQAVQQARHANKGRVLRPSKNPIHMQRVANLETLIDGRFDGSLAECARAIGRSYTFLWQLTNRYRAIGEDSARMIEEKLGLGVGTLDKRPGDAFERDTMLHAQLGNGQSTRVMLVPVITVGESVAAEKTRRKAMANANRFVPCDDTVTEDAYGIDVDFAAMEPRIRRGDRVIIEPKDHKLVDNQVYWLRPKGKRDAVMRVAHRQDSSRFTFVLPAENKRAHLEPVLELDDVEILGRATLVVHKA